MILCGRDDCDRKFHTAEAAGRHWLQHRFDDENQPIVAKGELVSVQLRNGEMITDYVTDYDIDRETGVHTMTVGQAPDIAKTIATLTEVLDLMKTITSEPEPPGSTRGFARAMVSLNNALNFVKRMLTQ